MSEPTEDSQLEYTYFSKIQIKIDGVSDEAGFWDACKALAQARRDRIDIDSYTGALQFLADANRHERWREPCGKHAILTEALLGLQAFKQETKVAEQALRLIGNCCIDNDSNREAVAPHLWSILEVLTEAEVGLRVTAFSALYNVVLDSGRVTHSYRATGSIRLTSIDNAAFEAAKLRVHDTLIEMLCAGKFGGQARSLEVLNMVRSIVSTAAESALPVLDSVSTCNALLSLGACDAQLSIDRSLYQTKSSYADLLCTLIMYLESDVFKEHSFDSKQLVDLLYVQRRGYSHANTMATEEHDYEDEDDEEDSASVREACQTLNRTLIRFSGIDEFGTIALESHDRLTSDLTNLSVNARDVLLEHLRIATTLEEHDIV